MSGTNVFGSGGRTNTAATNRTLASFGVGPAAQVKPPWYDYAIKAMTNSGIPPEQARRNADQMLASGVQPGGNNGSGNPLYLSNVPVYLWDQQNPWAGMGLAMDPTRGAAGSAAPAQTPTSLAQLMANQQPRLGAVAAPTAATGGRTGSSGSTPMAPAYGGGGSSPSSPSSPVPRGATTATRGSTPASPFTNVGGQVTSQALQGMTRSSGKRNTTYQAGDDPVAYLQQQQQTANKANEDRYKELLNYNAKDRAELLKTIQREYGGLKNLAKQNEALFLSREDDVRKGEMGTLQQGLQDRGLGNITVADSLRRGVVDDSQRRRQEISQAARDRAYSVGTQYVDALTRALRGSQTERQAIVEGRTDQGPSSALIAQLMSQPRAPTANLPGGTGAASPTQPAPAQTPPPAAPPAGPSTSVAGNLSRQGTTGVRRPTILDGLLGSPTIPAGGGVPGYQITPPTAQAGAPTWMPLPQNVRGNGGTSAAPPQLQYPNGQSVFAGAQAALGQAQANVQNSLMGGQTQQLPGQNFSYNPYPSSLYGQTTQPYAGNATPAAGGLRRSTQPVAADVGYDAGVDRTLMNLYARSMAKRGVTRLDWNNPQIQQAFIQWVSQRQNSQSPQYRG